ncbi:putative short-chain oxidoreductase [Mycena metata]|uniref:Short-chain oxidoreductase n=1 Tax=Mycena metata TaxID=1033252 RepID=A0AAD7J6M1_9AGAR|nr:putative short-chain oxidoreductase [Mycena metata]
MASDSPVFLITGCSSGLGRELAIAALHRSFRVIATARRVDTLDYLIQRGAKALSLDVTSSEAELAEVAAKAISIYGQVDYLVNNAGFMHAGVMEETSHEEVLRQFNTNFFGLVNTTRAFLPYFRARRTGTIVNISSHVSVMGLPGVGAYTASKAAVDAISDTWAHELAEYNIRSISIQAGLFRTEVLKPTDVNRAAKFVEGYQAGHEMIDHINETAGRREPGDPVKAAAKIIAFVTDPKRCQLSLRFVVGDDAFSNVRAFHSQQLADMDTAKEWSTGTSYPV